MPLAGVAHSFHGEAERSEFSRGALQVVMCDKLPFLIFGWENVGSEAMLSQGCFGMAYLRQLSFTSVGQPSGSTSKSVFASFKQHPNRQCTRSSPICSDKAILVTKMDTASPSIGQASESCAKFGYSGLRSQNKNFIWWNHAF